MKFPPLALLFLITLLSQALAPVRASLPRSTPEAEGIDSTHVLALVNALETKIDAVHSIMLLRHGKVVAEGWWAPYAAQDVHLMYSVSKSFTSTAIGFAAQEGLLSVHDLVLPYFPDLAPATPSPQMKAMRIEDLLMMSSGHQNDTAPMMRALKGGGWIRAFLASDVAHKPGTHFVYNSGGSYMLAAIIQKVTGMTVEAYLQPRLFTPLEIARHPWGLSPESINLGDGGLSLTTEDLAKFGQFYLQKGGWNGQRLLAEKWVETATSRRTSTGSDPDSNWDAGYGYQFWRNKTTGYRADGAQGQFSFVLPEWDVVLAITSGTNDTKTIMNLVWEHLLPAIQASALSANPAAQENLSHKLNSLSLPVQNGSAHSAREKDVSGKTYTFGENELGIKSIKIDFSTSNPVLTIDDAEGAHPITCGLDAWVRGRTSFQKRISNLFDVAEQGIAGSAAWSDDETFVTKLCFNETPYTMTARFKFSDEGLLLDLEQNVRWGPAWHPQLIGKKSD